MSNEPPPPVSDNSEDARALLQNRVALVWKIIFFIIHTTALEKIITFFY